VVSEAARRAAYAELVAGLLDVRDATSDERFDEAVEHAQQMGRIDVTTARELRLLQRRSVRAVIDHAQTVLPATMVSLEQAHRDAGLQATSMSESATEQHADDEPCDDDLSRQTGEDSEDGDARLDDNRDEDAFDVGHTADVDPAVSPLVDLTARRLLVAGLTPLPDT